MSNRQKLAIASVLVFIAVLGRLLPHLWNFTPVIAVSLLAGMYLGRSYAVFVPVATMVISDLFIGFYHLPIMISVYGSMVLAGWLAFLLRRYRRIETVAALSLVSSTLFFLVTNAAVWFFSPLYPAELSGLIASYVAGLPFYKNALVGDLFYSVTLFTSFQVVAWSIKRVDLRLRLSQKKGLVVSSR